MGARARAGHLRLVKLLLGIGGDIPKGVDAVETHCRLERPAEDDERGRVNGAGSVPEEGAPWWRGYRVEGGGWRVEGGVGSEKQGVKSKRVRSRDVRNGRLAVAGAKCSVRRAYVYPGRV